MLRGPRNKLPTRARELQILEFTLEGHAQRQIAEELGISRSCVRRTLARVDKRALAEINGRVEEVKARQTLRLEHIYREGMAAWHRSQEDAETEKVTAGDGKTTVQKTKRGQSGDPRFLEQARSALEDIRRIWGLNEEAKGHGNGATNVTIKVEYSEDFFGRDRITSPVVVEAVTTPEQQPALTDQTERKPDDETADAADNAA